MPDPQPNNDPWAKYAVKPAAPAAPAQDKWAQFASTSAQTDPLTQKIQSVTPQTSTQPYFQKPPEGTPFPSTNPIEKQGQRLDKLGARQAHAMNSPTPVSNASLVLSAPELVAQQLPSKIMAGGKFADVAGALEKIPVNLGKTKNAANAAQAVIDNGGKPSKLVSDFITKIGDNNSLSWKDARDFISNASSRSRLAELFEGQTGHARYAIGQFVGQLAQEIKDAATAAGQGEDYGEALKEYRNAMRISRALKVSAAAGAAYAMKKMTSASANNAVKTMWSALE